MRKTTAPVPSARRVAVEQLTRIDRDGAYVGLIGEIEEGQVLDQRTERQATDYVAGVTRWQR